jgi:NAD+ diphosphatase
VYIASQPWPFPASLMLGFQAQSPGGEPHVHDGELEQVGWFSRREVAVAALEGSSALLLPPPISIARNLIDRWIDRERCHH